MHYICIKKNHIFINVFSHKKIIHTYNIYAFKINHAEKVQNFIKKIIQTYIIYALKKNHTFINAILKTKSLKFHKCIFS